MEFITASRTYQPGDLIYEGDVFARVLGREKKDKKCEFCHKSSDDLIFCDCYDVKYCNAECRKKDKDDHKNECGKLNKLRGDALEDFVRLLARVIFKIKGKSWTGITRNILGHSISFEDINSHYEEIFQNQRIFLLCSGLKDALIEFIGEQNVPHDEDLIKIIGKVKFSTIELSHCLPEVFCFGIDKFKHECIPNSNIEVCDNNVVKIWAIKRIEPSEKITISRRSMLTSALPRSPLNEDTLEVCKCTECSSPYGETPLTKVLDKKRAYDAIRTAERAISISQTLSNLDLEDDFRLRLIVDKALEKQVGVLGPTNALHLKLLAVKGMTLQGTDIQKKMYLLELERNMGMVFGERYLEMRQIYEALTVLCVKLDSILEAAVYLKKAERVKAQTGSN